MDKPNFEQGGIIVASNDKTRHEKVVCSIKVNNKKYEVYP